MTRKPKTEAETAETETEAGDGGDEGPPKTPAQMQRERVRRAVAFLYDLQRLRIACGHRATDGNKNEELEETEKEFLGATGRGLRDLEINAFKEVKRLLKGIPIWEQWIKLQKGVGPGIGGILVSSIDITRSSTPSQLWSFCGLAVIVGADGVGHAPRPVKGQKLNYNSWLRSKLVKVAADCFIKANSPWRKVYDDCKHRRNSQRVPVCMACEGSGVSRYTKTKSATRETHPCDNCEGRGGNCKWGRSDAHRDQDARRIMMKMFLLQLWTTWRTLEGLPVRVPYHEEKLSMKHSGGEIDGTGTRGKSPAPVSPAPAPLPPPDTDEVDIELEALEEEETLRTGTRTK